MILNGEFLGRVGKTKKGGFIRRFLTDEGDLVKVYAKDDAMLEGREVDVQMPEDALVFASR